MSMNSLARRQMTNAHPDIQWPAVEPQCKTKYYGVHCQSLGQMFS